MEYKKKRTFNHASAEIYYAEANVLNAYRFIVYNSYSDRFNVIRFADYEFHASFPNLADAITCRDQREKDAIKRGFRMPKWDGCPCKLLRKLASKAAA